MIKKEALDFLKLLGENNINCWFKSFKLKYSGARENVEQCIEQLILKVLKFNPRITHYIGKSILFRIFRDACFSKDKSLFKLYFEVDITDPLKKLKTHSKAGYYIRISLSCTMLGGKIYGQISPQLKKIRRLTGMAHSVLKNRFKSSSVKKYFETIAYQLKTVTKDYLKSRTLFDLLGYKSFLAPDSCIDEQVLEDVFLQHAVRVFKTLNPFDPFFNKSIALR